MSDDIGIGSMPPPAISTRTFLIADIRGYTRYTRENGDEAASALTAQFAATVRAAVADHGCELLELRGDEALCVFGSARHALEAAVELQRRLRTAGEGSPPLALGVGAGLDAGEALLTEDGFRGGALNLAARLCSIASPGQILASEAVAHLAGRVDGLSFTRQPPARLKGLGAGVGVWAVVPDRPLPPVPPPPPKEAKPSRQPRSWRAGLALVAIVATAVVVPIWLAQGGSRRNAVALHSNSLVEIDPASGRVVADVPLQSAPGEIVSGGGAIWVGEADGTISRVGPVSLSARVLSTPVPPTSLAVGFGALWVYDSISDRVAEIDLNGTTPPQTYRARTCPYTGTECITGGIATGEGAVWIGRSYGSGASNVIGTVWKRDPTSFRLEATVTKVPADRLTLAEGSLWTFGNYGRSTAKVNTTTNLKIYRSLSTAAAVYDQPGFTYAFSHLWLVSTGTLFECDFDDQCTTVTVDSGAHDVAAAGDSLWVTSSSGAVTKVNPFTRTVVRTYRLGHQASGITFYHGHLWIGLGARG